MARRRGLACELQLNPFSCWAVEARKCYDTRPGTEIFWVFLINFFLHLINPTDSPTPPSSHTLTHRQPAAAVWPNSDLAYQGQNTSCVISTVVRWGKFGKLTPPLPPPVRGFQAYWSCSTRVMRMWTLDEPCMFFFFLTRQRGQTEFSRAQMFCFSIYFIEVSFARPDHYSVLTARYHGGELERCAGPGIHI